MHVRPGRDNQNTSRAPWSRWGPGGTSRLFLLFAEPRCVCVWASNKLCVCVHVVRRVLFVYAHMDHVISTVVYA